MSEEWGSDAESGQSSPESGPQFDIEAFAEWMETQADASGMSQQDLADELISSYWLFKELMNAVEQSESDKISAVGSPAPESTTGQNQEIEDSPDEDTDQVGELVKEMMEVLGDMSQKEGNQGEQEPTRQKNEVTREAPVKTDQPGDNILLAVLDHYRQILTDLEEVKSERDRYSEDISDFLTHLDDRLSECEERIEKSDEIADLEEATVKHTQEIDAVRDRVHEVEQEIDQISSSQETIENRIEEEFDTIEAVFNRFLRDISGLETHLEELTEEHRNDVQSIRNQSKKHHQLSELKREALRLGIKEGRCEECGEGVNISLLEAPNCPGCDRMFTGISKNKWIPFKSPVLETRPTQMDPVNTSTESESNVTQLLDSGNTEDDWSDDNQDRDF